MKKLNIHDDIKQANYILFHPFNGFWDLKRERPVTFWHAGVIVLLLIITTILRSQFTGFILDMSDAKDFNLFFQITGILIPFFIWCISNWCITTLVDGEGTLKDIVITTAYALIPMILLNIPMVVLSNIITIKEVVFYNILDVISIIWSVFLLIIGIMTIHQFSMKKTLATILIALLGMVIIIFIVLLFFTLLQNMINYLRLIFTEVSLR